MFSPVSTIATRTPAPSIAQARRLGDAEQRLDVGVRAERRRVDAGQAALDDGVAEHAGDGVVRAQRLDLRVVDLGAQEVRRALRRGVDDDRRPRLAGLRGLTRLGRRQPHRRELEVERDAVDGQQMLELVGFERLHRGRGLTVELGIGSVLDDDAARGHCSPSGS